MVDAAKEKHVPEVKVNGDTVEVCVGSVEHPCRMFITYSSSILRQKRAVR